MQRIPLCLAKYSGRYAKLVGPRIDQITAKQVEEEKQTSSGIYKQVLKNAVVKKGQIATNGGFNLNYNEEIEVKSRV
jgi:hypothetical protein